MKQHSSSTRLNFDFPEDAHRLLKIQAAKLGISIRELATQAILQKLEELEMQEDVEAYDRAMQKYNSGEMKTISHEEMMKRVGWDEI